MPVSVSHQVQFQSKRSKILVDEDDGNDDDVIIEDIITDAGRNGDIDADKCGVIEIDRSPSQIGVDCGVVLDADSGVIDATSSGIIGVVAGGTLGECKVRLTRVHRMLPPKP